MIVAVLVAIAALVVAVLPAVRPNERVRSAIVTLSDTVAKPSQPVVTDSVRRPASPVATEADSIPQRQRTLDVPPVAGEGTAGSLRDRVRPLRIGSSVGGVGATAGSLGGFAENEQGVRFLITDISALLLGGVGPGPVLQPGPADGGEAPRDIIASAMEAVSLTDSMPAKQLIAFAALRPDLEIDASVSEIGRIQGVASIDARMVGVTVRKVGRTSGLTAGVIRSVDAEIQMSVPDPDGEWLMVVLSGAIVSTPISRPGDGGALVIDEYGRAVGIIVGASQDMTIIAPLKPRLEDLGLRLVQ